MLVETNTSTVILKGIENNSRFYRGGNKLINRGSYERWRPIPNRIHFYCVHIAKCDRKLSPSAWAVLINVTVPFISRTWVACKRLGLHSCQSCVAKEAVSPVVPFSLMSLYFGTESAHLSIPAASSSLLTSHSTNTAKFIALPLHIALKMGRPSGLASNEFLIPTTGAMTNFRSKKKNGSSGERVGAI